jgi:hypothetical protein
VNVGIPFLFMIASTMIERAEFPCAEEQDVVGGVAPGLIFDLGVGVQIGSTVHGPDELRAVR